MQAVTRKSSASFRALIDPKDFGSFRSVYVLESSSGAGWVLVDRVSPKPILLGVHLSLKQAEGNFARLYATQHVSLGDTSRGDWAVFLQCLEKTLARKALVKKPYLHEWHLELAEPLPVTTAEVPIEAIEDKALSLISKRFDDAFFSSAFDDLKPELQRLWVNSPSVSVLRRLSFFATRELLELKEHDAFKGLFAANEDLSKNVILGKISENSEEKLQAVSSVIDFLRSLGKDHENFLLDVPLEILGDEWISQDPAKAKKCFEEALRRRGSKDLALLDKLTHLAEKTGDHALERESLQKTLKETKDPVLKLEKIARLAALLLRDRSKAGEALKLIEEGLSLQVDSVPLIVLKSRALAETNRAEEAADDLIKALGSEMISRADLTQKKALLGELETLLTLKLSRPDLLTVHAHFAAALLPQEAKLEINTDESFDPKEILRKWHAALAEKNLKEMRHHERRLLEIGVESLDLAEMLFGSPEWEGLPNDYLAAPFCDLVRHGHWLDIPEQRALAILDGDLYASAFYFKTAAFRAIEPSERERLAHEAIRAFAALPGFEDEEKSLRSLFSMEETNSQQAFGLERGSVADAALAAEAYVPSWKNNSITKTTQQEVFLNVSGTHASDNPENISPPASSEIISEEIPSLNISLIRPTTEEEPKQAIEIETAQHEEPVPPPALQSAVMETKTEKIEIEPVAPPPAPPPTPAPPPIPSMASTTPPLPPPEPIGSNFEVKEELKTEMLNPDDMPQLSIGTNGTASAVMCDWRAIILKGDFADMSHKTLPNQPFANELEKHIALQTVALALGNLSLLDQWHMKVWREKKSWVYNLSGKDRFPLGISQPVLESPLAQLMYRLIPLMNSVFEKELSFEMQLRRDPKASQADVKQMRILSLEDPLVQNSFIPLVSRRIVQLGYQLAVLPFMGRKVMVDIARRVIVIDEDLLSAHYPPSIAFHGVMTALWKVRLGYAQVLGLSVTQHLLPLLSEIYQYFGTDFKSKFKARLGLAPMKLGLHSRTLAQLRLGELAYVAGDTNIEQLKGLQHAMMQHCYQMDLADTLDMIGVIEGMFGVDIVHNAKLKPGRILQSSEHIDPLFKFATKLRFA